MHGIHPKTCTHHIYTDSNVKPVRQPHRRMNPMLQDIVREELQKMLKVNFIYPISDSQWVSPLVVVPKKNGKWRICVDYRQLNKATLKDYFPLRFIDQVLDTLGGKSSFSFLDGFSGYNQIRIALEDQDKTTFTCPWGTYAYNVFPFGLCNAPATFQRAVLAIFADLVHDCVEVYMDDFSVYGDSFEHALTNLEKVLKRCIEANLSISNEKCFIMLNEGIVLGHYISSHDIKVDPSKIQIIVDLPIPKTQKEVRSFLGYASYYRRFIEHFSRIALPLFKLLAKYAPFNWNDNCQQVFETLKAKISTTPVLKGPNWDLPFHIFIYASDTTVGASLGQKEQSCHYAIYFISKNLTLAELNYTVTEKEMLSVIHAVNKFRHYITGYEVFVHTDHSAIKHLINKPVTSGRVTRWLLLLQEFNITVLDRLGKENQVADFLSRLQNQGEVVPVEDSFPDENLFAILVVNPWYVDLANYLSTGRTPPSFTSKEKKRLIKQSARYSWVNGDLVYTGYDMIIRRCVRNDEIIDILNLAMMNRVVGILQLNEPHSRSLVLDTTGYPFSRIPKTKALVRATEQIVVNFLFEEIFVRYGVPREIVTDQGTQFTSKLVKEITAKYQIKHRRSTPYHPQANGQVESTNKILEGIITKAVAMNRKNWEEKLKDALWAYRITWKNTTGFTPYQLVYGKEVMLPIEFQIHTFKMAADLGIDLNEAQQESIQQLNQLDEMQ
eukprot:PITA_25549